MNGDHRWDVSLTTRSCEPDLTSDSRVAAQRAALKSHVLLIFGDSTCAARFSVRAADMAHALRSAMGRWAHVTETARLPWWQITHLEIDLVPDEAGEEGVGDEETGTEATAGEGVYETSQGSNVHRLGGRLREELGDALGCPPR